MQRRLKTYIFSSVIILCSSVAHAVTFDWAIIGNTGNTADSQTSYGSVDYTYSISTTEVSTGQYVEFLNAVAGVDTYGLYNSDMSNSEFYKGISIISGSGTGADPYEYSANSGWKNRPVVYVSCYDAMRFVNWLHNGQLSGPQDASTTEYGAYDMTQSVSITRLEGAQVWLPSEDEWYKAAYYDPVNEVFYDYATGTDIQPNNNAPDSDTGNSANYRNPDFSIDSPYYYTEVGAYDESESPYGTYDQSGNVWEWTETLVGSDCNIRDGAWNNLDYLMPAYYRHTYNPIYEDNGVGFRVASSYIGGDTIPEPASVGLLLLSISGFVFRRAKKS